MPKLSKSHGYGVGISSTLKFFPVHFIVVVKCNQQMYLLNKNLENIPYKFIMSSVVRCAILSIQSVYIYCNTQFYVIFILANY